MATKPITIWQIHDGKPGHCNQLRGLTQALAELLPIAVHSLRAPTRRQSLAALWSKHCPLGAMLPAPDMILGAGNLTHLFMLAARRARGGRAIVLMKPSLPTALFDLCLVPEHDCVTASSNVIATRGVLNAVRPTPQHNPRAGLLLIGGPSAAHNWSDARMFTQIAEIVHATPAIRWQLTGSRRTPASFLPRLQEQNFANLQIIPHQETTPDWVPTQLAQAAHVWVSEDSVSMVYEALTSGAAVGVLEVPCKRRGRVAVGMDALVRDGWVTPFSAWHPGSPLAPPPELLYESRRCAQLLCERFFVPAAA